MPSNPKGNKPEWVFGLQLRCRELDIFKIFFEKLFGNFLDFLGEFFSRIFFGGIFLGVFLEDFWGEFFGRIFLGGFFGRNTKIILI
jgi:hypothetical protein